MIDLLICPSHAQLTTAGKPLYNALQAKAPSADVAPLKTYVDKALECAPKPALFDGKACLALSVAESFRDGLFALWSFPTSDTFKSQIGNFNAANFGSSVQTSGIGGSSVETKREKRKKKKNEEAEVEEVGEGEEEEKEGKILYVYTLSQSFSLSLLVFCCSSPPSPPSLPPFH